MSSKGEGEDASTKEASDAIKIERTLRLLDSEIEHIRSAETQHGWTSWGLVGGIVGLLWLLSNYPLSSRQQSALNGSHGFSRQELRLLPSTPPTVQLVDGSDRLEYPRRQKL